MKYVFIILSAIMFSCHNAADKPLAKDTASTGTSAADDKTIAKTTTDTALPYDQYCNGRFNFCIDYPPQLMDIQPESENGDGCIFKNKKSEECLRVYGRYNADVEGNAVTIAEQFKTDLASKNTSRSGGNSSVSYQKLGHDFFVISGMENGKIYYQKTILKNDFFAYAILRYEEDEKVLFDKISEQIFKSFK